MSGLLSFLRHQVLKLAGLVASEAPTAQVVPLDPQPCLRPEGLGQSGQGLQRCGGRKVQAGRHGARSASVESEGGRQHVVTASESDEHSLPIALDQGPLDQHRVVCHGAGPLVVRP